MSEVPASGSARRQQLLDLAYGYVLEHGLADMSLRPLAEAVGSSPRVLLFLFDSKDELIKAILGRAREEELRWLERQVPAAAEQGLARTGEAVWRWLADPEHRRLLTLWVESYARSLADEAGPWAGFARRTVEDWDALLAAAQPPARRTTDAGAAERTLLLAVLRGALLDLLATGDQARADAAVAAHLRTLDGGAG